VKIISERLSSNTDIEFKEMVCPVLYITRGYAITGKQLKLSIKFKIKNFKL